MHAVIWIKQQEQASATLSDWVIFPYFDYFSRLLKEPQTSFKLQKSPFVTRMTTVLTKYSKQFKKKTSRIASVKLNYLVA